MANQDNKQVPKQQQRDETAAIVASIFNLTPRAVRMVIQGDIINEPVFQGVMMYKEGKSKLIQEIEKLVPIETKRK